MLNKTLAVALFLIFVACEPLSSTPNPTPAPALISCNDYTPSPNQGSILPTFEPATACELEDISRHVEFCLVHASEDISYPCTQTETVKESIVGQGEQRVLIQRDYNYSKGCWHGVNSHVRALRLCSKETGRSTFSAEDIKGDLIPSPNGDWLAFVDAEPNSYGLRPHIFIIRPDGSEMRQLDTQPFPQAQVVGISQLQWHDGNTLDISLWDGTAGGNHNYRLHIDGSGDFELQP